MDGAAAGEELPCACGETIKIPHVHLEAFDEETPPPADSPVAHSEADAGQAAVPDEGLDCGGALEHSSPVNADEHSVDEPEDEHSVDEPETVCLNALPDHSNSANAFVDELPGDLENQVSPSSEQTTESAGASTEVAADAETQAGTAEDNERQLPIIASPQLHNLDVSPDVFERLLQAQALDARRRARLPIVGSPELYELVAPVDRRDEEGENRSESRVERIVCLPIVGFPELYKLVAPVDRRVQEIEYRNESRGLRAISLPIVGIPELYELEAPDDQRDQGSENHRESPAAQKFPLPIVAAPVLHRIQSPVVNALHSVLPGSLTALRQYASVSLDVSVTTATAINMPSESELSVEMQDHIEAASADAEAAEEGMDQDRSDSSDVEAPESLDELRASIERLVEEGPVSDTDHSATAEGIAEEINTNPTGNEQENSGQALAAFPEVEQFAVESDFERPERGVVSDGAAMPVELESESLLEDGGVEREARKSTRMSSQTSPSEGERDVIIEAEEAQFEDSETDSVICPDCDTPIFVSDRMENQAVACSCGGAISTTGPLITTESAMQTDDVPTTTMAADCMGEPSMPQSDAGESRPERSRSRNHHADASGPTHVKGKDMRVEGPILGALVRFASIAILVSIFAGIWSFIRISRQREDVVLKQSALPTRKASPFVGALASGTDRDGLSTGTKEDGARSRGRTMGTLKPIGLTAEPSADLASDGINDENGQVLRPQDSLTASQSPVSPAVRVTQRRATSDFLDTLAVLSEQLKQSDRLDHERLSGFADAVKQVGIQPVEFSVSDLFWLADCWESFAVRAETSDLAGRCYWQAAAACALAQEIKTIEVEQVALAKRRHADLSDRSRKSLRLAVKQSADTDSKRTRK